MAERKSFLLRIEPAVLAAIQKWANDDLRSLNAQIEYLLRQALQRAGRSALPTVGGSASSVPELASRVDPVRPDHGEPGRAQSEEARPLNPR